MKKYKIWKEGRFYESKQPGNYAAITTQKIVGRLDCPSGKRAKRKNRIFLNCLEDKPRGFRYCKICKPQEIRTGDVLDDSEKRTRQFLESPHIAIWQTGWILKNGRQNPKAWYVCLQWQKEMKKAYLHGQLNLTEHDFYQRTAAAARELAKKLNVPLIKHHWRFPIVVMWLPKEASTNEQHQEVKRLLKRKGMIVITYPKIWYGKRRG